MRLDATMARLQAMLSSVPDSCRGQYKKPCHFGEAPEKRNKQQTNTFRAGPSMYFFTCTQFHLKSLDSLMLKLLALVWYRSLHLSSLHNRGLRKVNSLESSGQAERERESSHKFITFIKPARVSHRQCQNHPTILNQKADGVFLAREHCAG